MAWRKPAGDTMRSCRDHANLGTVRVGPVGTPAMGYDEAPVVCVGSVPQNGELAESMAVNHQVYGL